MTRPKLSEFCRFTAEVLKFDVDKATQVLAELSERAAVPPLHCDPPATTDHAVLLSSAFALSAKRPVNFLEGWSSISSQRLHGTGQCVDHLSEARSNERLAAMFGSVFGSAPPTRALVLELDVMRANGTPSWGALAGIQYLPAIDRQPAMTIFDYRVLNQDVRATYMLPSQRPPARITLKPGISVSAATLKRIADFLGPFPAWYVPAFEELRQAHLLGDEVEHAYRLQEIQRRAFADGTLEPLSHRFVQLAGNDSAAHPAPSEDIEEAKHATKH